MTSTLLDLTTWLPVRMVPYQTVEVRPRWTMGEVILCPCNSPDEHARHMAETLGSDSVWYEEVRFGKSDGLLKSLILRVPDENMALESELSAWENAHAVSGSLQLVSSSDRFENDAVADVRYLADDGRAMLCLGAQANSTRGERLRLQITPQVELLFSGKVFCGWKLDHPARFLTTSPWTDPPDVADDPAMTGFLRTFFALVSAETFEQFDAGDPELRERLVSLRNQLMAGESPNSPRFALRIFVERVLEKYYRMEFGASGPEMHQ